MAEKFTLHDLRLFAPIRIGALTGYAHLDTGARHSSVRQSYAGPFEKVGTREMRVAFGAATVSRVRIDELAFLGQFFRDIEVDALPDQFGGFDALPFKVLAALGSDMLLRYPLRLDFLTGTIAFADAERLAPRVAVKADYSFGAPLFQMALGEQPLTAAFDIGAAMSVLNATALSRLQDRVTAAEPLEAEDPTGAKMMLPTYVGNSLKIGEYPLGECRFLVIDMRALEQVAGLRADFVLGVSAMQGRTWALDRERSVIEIE